MTEPDEPHQHTIATVDVSTDPVAIAGGQTFGTWYPIETYDWKIHPERALLSGTYARVKWVEEGFFRQSSRKWQGRNLSKPPTHWMPLPDPA